MAALSELDVPPAGVKVHTPEPHAQTRGETVIVKKLCSSQGACLTRGGRGVGGAFSRNPPSWHQNTQGKPASPGPSPGLAGAAGAETHRT